MFCHMHYRHDVLRELEGTGAEADDATAALGLGHVDVVVGVRFEPRVVHLRIEFSYSDSRRVGGSQRNASQSKRKGAY